MKIICEFDSLEEFEQFRVSGKATRQRKKDEVDEVAQPTPVEQTAQAIRDAQPVQTFTPPPAAAPQGFPGGNSGSAPVHPLVTAILARIDGAINSGQAADAIVTWFRQQIGPDAAQATLDQIKQVFVPRMTEMQLKQIAPQLGITG
jgi:hypothetical protein